MDTIPDYVIDTLIRIREQRGINMLDYDRVVRDAERIGHPFTAMWLVNNQARYVEVLEAVGKQVDSDED